MPLDYRWHWIAPNIEQRNNPLQSNTYAVHTFSSLSNVRQRIFKIEDHKNDGDRSTSIRYPVMPSGSRCQFAVPYAFSQDSTYLQPRMVCSDVNCSWNCTNITHHISSFPLQHLSNPEVVRTKNPSRGDYPRRPRTKSSYYTTDDCMCHRKEESSQQQGFIKYPALTT